MATFLLVHGAFHGAWCWREALTRLERLGHRAEAIDLPGHGDDRTPLGQLTLRDYINTVLCAVTRLQERSVLVIHSLGALGAAVAEAIPDRIQALIGVATAEPPNGQPMTAVLADADPEYLAQFGWSADGKLVHILPRGIREFVYQLCPAAIIDEAIQRVTPEPMAIFEEPIRLTSERFGRVPRYWIGCHDDKVVPPAAQRRLCEGLPADHVYSLDADHAPFFSAPDELVFCMNKLASR